jgi:hypothetical protein
VVSASYEVRTAGKGQDTSRAPRPINLAGRTLTLSLISCHLLVFLLLNPYPNPDWANFSPSFALAASGAAGGILIQSKIKLTEATAACAAVLPANAELT